MTKPDTRSAASSLGALRRFTRAQPPVERCELCGAVLPLDHPHLLERQSRAVACSCHACAILFYGQEGSRYLRIPRRMRRLDDFAFTDLEWEEMTLPIGLAFFVRREDGTLVALYPSPAGVVESLISLNNCGERIAAHPLLRTMEPEVEALLVNRAGKEHAYFLVPIDECFRLAGLIRTTWRGLSGGPGAQAAIAQFFAELREKTGRTQVHHA